MLSYLTAMTFNNIFSIFCGKKVRRMKNPSEGGWASVKAVAEQQIERFPFSDPIVNVLKLNIAMDNAR